MTPVPLAPDAPARPLPAPAGAPRGASAPRDGVGATLRRTTRERDEDTGDNLIAKKVAGDERGKAKRAEKTQLHHTQGPGVWLQAVQSEQIRRASWGDTRQAPSSRITKSAPVKGVLRAKLSTLASAIGRWHWHSPGWEGYGGSTKWRMILDQAERPRIPSPSVCQSTSVYTGDHISRVNGRGPVALDPGAASPEVRLSEVVGDISHTEVISGQGLRNDSNQGTNRPECAFLLIR